MRLKTAVEHPLDEPTVAGCGRHAECCKFPQQGPECSPGCLKVFLYSGYSGRPLTALETAFGWSLIWPMTDSNPYQHFPWYATGRYADVKNPWYCNTRLDDMYVEHIQKQQIAKSQHVHYHYADVCHADRTEEFIVLPLQPYKYHEPKQKQTRT